MNYQNLAIYLFNNSLWMSWNLFLALIPFLLSSHLFHPKRKVSLVWSIGLVFFILFLPNAPYIMTDLIHLYKTTQYVNSPFFLLVATLQFLAFELIGFWLFANGYKRFEKFVLKRSLYQLRYVIRLVAFLTMSIGVYMGRFLRLNSWDVFSSPRLVLSMLDQLWAKEAALYIGSFAVILFVLYQAHEYLSINNKNYA